jgi:hypothetical protein
MRHTLDNPTRGAFTQGSFSGTSTELALGDANNATAGSPLSSVAGSAVLKQWAADINEATKSIYAGGRSRMLLAGDSIAANSLFSTNVPTTA